MINYNLKKFENTQMSLWYKGIMQDSITEKLIDIVEADDNTGKSKKKISFLMAESFQNIVRHGLTDTKKTIPAFFGVTNKFEVISIFSSNCIKHEQGVFLSEKFNNINDLNKEELKNYYREMLSTGTFSEKGGAGLGLIEMARKSGEPIQYHLEENGDFSDFSMQIDKSLSKESVKSIDITEGVELYKQFKSKGVLLFFKGIFDENTTNNIVQMLSQNIEKKDQLSKIIFHSSVELIQNITRHSLIQNNKIQGVFLFSKLDGKITISTINYISSSAKKTLENHLLKIDGKSTIELSNLYRKTLKESVKNNLNNAGIGLIDIAKYGTKLTSLFKHTEQGIQVEITATINLDF